MFGAAVLRCCLWTYGKTWYLNPKNLNPLEYITHVVNILNDPLQSKQPPVCAKPVVDGKNTRSSVKRSSGTRSDAECGIRGPLTRVTAIRSPGTIYRLVLSSPRWSLQSSLYGPVPLAQTSLLDPFAEEILNTDHQPSFSGQFSLSCVGPRGLIAIAEY